MLCTDELQVVPNLPIHSLFDSNSIASPKGCHGNRSRLYKGPVGELQKLSNSRRLEEDLKQEGNGPIDLRQ